jgi:uncharacterized membrane protein
MAQTDFYSNFHLLIRWLHVIAGITWIGHLYFFNFVNGPLQGKLDGPTKKAVNPQLMPRALFWFRWGAMITFLMGLTLFTMIYMYTPGRGFGPSIQWAAPDEAISERALWIVIGMVCGFVMWFNVWFVIWPRQKVIQAGVRDGTPVDPQLGKTAALASKINTYLSGPMLFGMLAPSHYGSINIPTAVVAIALGLFAIWWAYQGAPKAGAAFATEGKGGAGGAAAAPAAAPAATKN